MESEFEGSCDAEVGARAAHRPEKVGVVVRTRPYVAAVGRYELDCEQVVDRQTEPALESPHATAQREPGDAGVTDHAHWADETHRHRRAIELREERSAVGTRGPLARVDRDTAHGRKVDDYPVVTGRETGQAVAAAANRDRQVVLAAETQRRDDLVRVGGPDDHGGAAGGHFLPHASGPGRGVGGWGGYVAAHGAP